MLYFEKSIMEVIILAGGLGTRLRSVVSEVPKCMAPIAGKPFLWYILKYLTKYNVSKVILSVGYLREVIFQWIDKVKDDFPFSFDSYQLCLIVLCILILLLLTNLLNWSPEKLKFIKWLYLNLMKFHMRK